MIGDYYKLFFSEAYQVTQAWSKLLSKLSVKGAIPVRYDASNYFGMTLVRAIARVPAVKPTDDGISIKQTGELVEVVIKNFTPHDLHLKGEGEMLKWVVKLTRGIYLHEMYEQMFLGDVQVYDPHSPEGEKAVIALENEVYGKATDKR